MRSLNVFIFSSLAASGLVAAASPPTFFYEFPQSTRQTTITLSQVDTRLSLASKLGVSRYHSLGKDSSLLQVEKGDEGQKGSLWLDKYDREGSVLISISGVANPKSLLSKQIPTIELKDQPSSSSFGELLTNLRIQKEQVTGHQAVNLYENPLGSFAYIISPTGSSDVRLRSANPNDWKDFESLARSGQTSAFDQETAADMNFVQEFVALSALLGKEMDKVTAERATVIAQFVGLEKLHRDYGASSKQYEAAVGLISELLSKLAGTEPSYRTVFAFLAPSTRVAKRDFVGAPVKFERKEIPVAVEIHEAASAKADGDKGKSKPTPTDLPFRKYVDCFRTKMACEQVSANCSGRGDCVESKVEQYCWSCKCNATIKRDGNGKVVSKTYWGGSACQKKDVSVPFWLLLSFSIGMLFIVYSAVGTMLDIGKEELPGVLSAGVSGVKRN